MTRFGVWIGSALIAALPMVAVAQDQQQSLADIRQELTVLWVELQKLRKELNTNGSATGIAQGTTLDRVSAIESELQRLTAKTEQLEFRIDRVVQDGTNQIGDLEFRLCELEEGCDIATLGDTPTLGGGSAPSVAPIPTQPANTGPELALGEQSAFDQATAMLDQGDPVEADRLYSEFMQNYPGSPLTAAAELGRGRALQEMGDTREAARSYLASFSNDQTGPTAPSALYALGVMLGQLGQTNEACVTLGEVSNRFPGEAELGAAAVDERTALGCS